MRELSEAVTPPRIVSSREHWIPWLLLALGVGTLYAWNVERYFFLGDDAYISFRYAENLALGRGLVWNAAEYVEGYTNFLWVLILSLGIRLGLAPEGLSAFLGIASGVGVLLALGAFSLRRFGPLHPATWLPLFALALSRSFTAWSTGGLATQFFTLLILVAQIQFISERWGTGKRAPLSALLFAIATLTRPEGGIFTATAGLVFLFEVARGRAAWRELFVWMMPWFAIVGAHFLWRHGYYGAWLPNTFHAKVNGFWPEQGRVYFSLFHDDYKLAFFLPLVLLSVIRGKSPAQAFLASSVGIYCFYLFVIGGGRFEFRFLVAILPALYWLVADGLRALGEWEPASGLPRSGRSALAGLSAVLLLAFTHLGSIRSEATRDRHHVEALPRTKWYADDRARQGRILAGYIAQGLLPEDLMLCVGGAGALPYYAGWPTLDFRGLNDAKIAGSELDRRGVIAHEHYADEAYMRERGVVIFDSLNHLVHDADVMRYAGKTARRGDREWPLRGVRVGDHALVFSTLVSEREFRRHFGHLEVLF